MKQIATPEDHDNGHFTTLTGLTVKVCTTQKLLADQDLR